MRIPRSEYPRPQLVRRDWVCLNGEWDFAFDDCWQGDANNWYNSIPEQAEKIVVPYAFQSKASGIAATGFHDVVWYWREVEIPPSWDGHHILLHFGAVDYCCRVFVNGHLACEHIGGHTPFAVDISSFINDDGIVFIALCAEDVSADKTVLRGKQYWKEPSEGIFYTRTTGIWQSVWLEPVAEARIDYLRWTPDIDENCVHLEAELSSHAAGGSLEIIVYYEGRIVVRDTVESEGSSLRAVVDFEDFDTSECLWSPEQPNLFSAEIRLYSGGLFTDCVRSYFGMRKFHAAERKLYLNNKEFYPKLVLDQGYWPEGLLTAPADDDFKKDILIAQQLGFNGARKHQKIEDPRYLYWADQLGFVVWAEMANAHEFSPDMGVRLMMEWLTAVRRDYNHPCIMAWVPLNESWGVPDIACDEEQQCLAASLYMMTKALDCTRFVISNDGWEHTQSDILGIHNYNDAATLKKNCRTALCALRSRPAGKKMYANGYKYGEQPIMFTEYGGIAFVVDAGEGWGYSVVKTPAELIDAYRQVTEALLESAVVAGFC